MKNKLLKSLAIILCLTFCLTGCGDKETPVNPTESCVVEDSENSTTEIVNTEDIIDSENTENVENSEVVTGTILEENGHLKESFEGHDRNELWEIADIVFKAYQEIDLDTLKIYLSEEDYEDAASNLAAVKENAEDYQMWQNTVGKMIYFADSDVLLAKSTQWVEYRWYADCWKANAEIPADESEDFTKEYLKGIYDKYYVEAPYIAVQDLSDEMNFRVEDGYVKCDISDILEEAEHGDWWDLFNSYLDGAFYAALILNSADCFGLGYDYIAYQPDGEPQIPDYEVFYSKDLTKFVEVVEGYNVEDTGIYMETFNNYYKDKAKRAIIQQYLNEKCEIIRGLSGLAIVFPANEEHYGYQMLTEEDFAYIESLGIRCVEIDNMYEFPEYWGNNFSPYYELVQCVKYEGLLD